MKYQDMEQMPDESPGARRGRAGRQQAKRNSNSMEMTNYQTNYSKNVQEPAEAEIDMSMDLQLHPLRDSKWTEIFPVLSIFDNSKQENIDRGNNKR